MTSVTKAAAISSHEGTGRVNLGPIWKSIINIPGTRQFPAVLEWNDGNIITVAEYSLERDSAQALPAETLEVSAEIEALPNLNGHGNVYDLQQAMVSDSTSALKALVEAFTSEEDLAGRESTYEQAVFKWTGADFIASNAHGPFIDSRKVAVLEKCYGTGLFARGRESFHGYRCPRPSNSSVRSFEQARDWQIFTLTMNPRRNTLFK
jgi:hypothetical protein